MKENNVLEKIDCIENYIDFLSGEYDNIVDSLGFIEVKGFLHDLRNYVQEQKILKTPYKKIDKKIEV